MILRFSSTNPFKDRSKVLCLKYLGVTFDHIEKYLTTLKMVWTWENEILPCKLAFLSIDETIWPHSMYRTPTLDHKLLRGVINGMAGKAADLPKFSDTLNPISTDRGRLCPPIGFASPKKFPPLRPCSVLEYILDRIFYKKPPWKHKNGLQKWSYI